MGHLRRPGWLHRLDALRSPGVLYDAYGCLRCPVVCALLVSYAIHMGVCVVLVSYMMRMGACAVLALYTFIAGMSIRNAMLKQGAV
jgi:hypothetical protein